MSLRLVLLLLALLLLALDWAALDDITTAKTATSFTPEYAMLVVSVPLFIALGWAAWRDWRRARSDPGSRSVP